MGAGASNRSGTIHSISESVRTRAGCAGLHSLLFGASDEPASFSPPCEPAFIKEVMSMQTRILHSMTIGLALATGIITFVDAEEPASAVRGSIHKHRTQPG